MFGYIVLLLLFGGGLYAAHRKGVRIIYLLYPLALVCEALSYLYNRRKQNWKAALAFETRDGEPYPLYPIPSFADICNASWKASSFRWADITYWWKPAKL